MKHLRLQLALTAMTVCAAGVCWSAGPMGHYLISVQTAQNIKNGSVNAPPELRTALQHPEAMRAFAGGAVGPDICEGKSHYGNTADLARNMIDGARSDLKTAAHNRDQQAFDKAQKELAFAYGWLTHCAADLNVHPAVNAMTGDTYRDNNSGEKTIHAAQEAQLTAYLKTQVSGKYDVSVPYDFLSRYTGVSVNQLKSENMKLTGKVMAELVAANQVTVTDQMRSKWGEVLQGTNSDIRSFIGNPKSMGNWDLDSGKISSWEFDDLRKMAIEANGGKLPSGWGKSYMDWYHKTQGLSRDQKLAKLKQLSNGHSSSVASGAGFGGSWSTDWGPMKLSVSGSSVTGTYTHDQGKINGAVSADGRTLTGTWSEYPSYSPPGDAGDVKLTLSADGKSFSGNWGYGHCLTSGGWVGTKN